MLAQRAAGIGAAASLVGGALGTFLLDQRDRTVEPDREHVVARGQIGVDLPVLHVRAEAAHAGDDRFAVVGMLTDLARQREEAERAVEVDVVCGEAFRQRRSLRLLAVDGFAQLDIGPEAARADSDFKPARRIFAELLHAVFRGAVPVSGRELPRVAAFGIVGAANEAAEFAELEREPTGLAVRA